MLNAVAICCQRCVPFHLNVYDWKPVSGQRMNALINFRSFLQNDGADK